MRRRRPCDRKRHWMWFAHRKCRNTGGGEYSRLCLRGTCTHERYRPCRPKRSCSCKRHPDDCNEVALVGHLARPVVHRRTRGCHRSLWCRCCNDTGQCRHLEVRVGTRERRVRTHRGITGQGDGRRSQACDNDWAHGMYRTAGAGCKCPRHERQCAVATGLRTREQRIRVSGRVGGCRRQIHSGHCDRKLIWVGDLHHNITDR